MDQIGVLDANIGHVQRDVTEIKNDQRRAADKLDAMNGRLDMLRDKIDKVAGDANQRIDALSANVTETRTDLTEKLDSTSKELSGEMKDMRKDFSLEMGTMRKDLGLEISNVRKDITAEVNGVRSDLSHLRNELAAVKSSVAASRVSTLKFQLTIAAGLLGVMAHGFKWI